MRLSGKWFAGVAVCFGLGCTTGNAVPITVANGSFESPTTPFVTVNINFWQKGPKPSWYVEDGGFLWEQLIGGFKNTESTEPDHLFNCDGDQALWLFAVPEVELFQDALAPNPALPFLNFNATYEPGRFYSLSLGINGGGGNMLEGVELQIGLYYRDEGGNKILIATTKVVHSVAAFPDHQHFTDFRVHVPVVRPTDPWAGKLIGIQVLSKATQENQGGYWDLDNVRLDSGPDPLSCAPSGSNARIAWPSLQGYRYQLQRSADLQLWTNFGAVQDGSGGELFQLTPVAGSSPSYFRTQVTPVAPGLAPAAGGKVAKKHRRLRK
jgi:hypothetical protein